VWELSVTGLYDQISYLILKASRALHSRRAMNLNAVGLHCGQDLVLLELGKQEGLRPSELADRLGVEPPTVTKMLQRMESAGTVMRSADPEDARAMCVYLTDTGHNLREHVGWCWQDLESQVLTGLTPDEQVLFRRLLLRVITNLEQPPREPFGQNGM
jgi:DNA-binding MarR family transcriptional regulator